MPHDYRQAKLLVELAALAAYHGDAFLRSATGMSRAGIESYWLASRNRLDIWAGSLMSLEVIAKRQAYSDGPPDPEVWNRLLPLQEEILASEVLTRIWTTIGCEMDRRQDAQEVEPFVRSVLVGHLETRHRLLRLTFNKLNLTPEQLRHTDRTRRRAERWTDVLMGYLVDCCRVGEFAFDPNRVNDFSASLKTQNGPGEATSTLLLASLRSSFQVEFTGNCPNPIQNGRICETVLSCFGSDIFDSTGQFRSLWEIRLSQAARDTQGMIDCLAAEHENSASQSTDSCDHGDPS